MFSNHFKICFNFRCAGDEDQCTDLVNFVQLNIEEATLKDRQLNQVQFHLPLKTTKLPNIFNLMESARGDPDLQLEDYSISQMTLDEVRTFLVFISAPPLSQSMAGGTEGTIGPPQTFSRINIVVLV